MNRSRYLALAFLSSGIVALTSPARAAGPYLKLKTEAGQVEAGKPIRLRLTAVSARTLTLPVPVVAVDEGQGFVARTDLACSPAAETTVTPDKAASVSCELTMARAGKSRIRLEYRLSEGVARTNAVTVEVGGTASANGAN